MDEYMQPNIKRFVVEEETAEDFWEPVVLRDCETDDYDEALVIAQKACGYNSHPLRIWDNEAGAVTWERP